MVDDVPIFCLVTTDRVSKRKVYFNFKASDDVPKPDCEFIESKLVDEISKPKYLDEYLIPLQSSPMFLPRSEQDETENNTKRLTITEKQDSNPDSYVIEIRINRSFALKKVLTSQVIMHYLIAVTCSVIEDKYNKNSQNLKTGEFIGHQLDFDPERYEILKDKLYVERSNKFVKNKVTLLDSATGIDNNETKKSDNNSSQVYDLYYRPSSKILTCSIKADKIPDSITFNDDRIIVETKGSETIDILLPFFINLYNPVYYKYEDKSLLLRIVAKILEEPLVYNKKNHGLALAD